MDHVPGTIYLLHLDRPYKHAKHYLGWASDLQARLASHADGTGARLLKVVKDAGIGWTLARTWQGDRDRERQLKRQGGRSRMCPLCKHTQPAAPTAATAMPAVAITAAEINPTAPKHADAITPDAGCQRGRAYALGARAAEDDARLRLARQEELEAGQ